MSSTRFSMNFTHIIGKLGRDPEMRTTPNGAMVTNFSVAVDDYNGKDTTGKAQYVTSWFDCNIWGDPTAKIVNDNFRKGDMVAVTGSMRQREYTNKEGNNVKTWELKATDVVLCREAPGSAPAEAEEEEMAPAPVKAATLPPMAASRTASPSRGRAPSKAPADDLDDVPFD